MHRRDHTVSTRLNTAEYDLLKTLAREAGLPISEYIRRAMLKAAEALTESNHSQGSDSALSQETVSDLRRFLETLLYTMLYHLPEIPPERKSAAAESARLRLKKALQLAQKNIL